MPQKRHSINKGFPTGWRWIGKTIYYNVPKGREYLWGNKKLYKLGNSPSEAYREWLKRVDTMESAKNIGELLDQYMQRVVPDKKPATQAGNKKQVGVVRKAFGHIKLHEIRPMHVYQYYTARKAKIAAKREIALLSHAFTKAVEWGYIDRHPFKGEVRLKVGKAGTRYVEDWEILECLKLRSNNHNSNIAAIQSYIKLKLLTGLRMTDLLLLKLSDIRKDGLYVTISKTGIKVKFAMTLQLKGVLQEAINSRPVEVSQYVFCNNKAQCYINQTTWDMSSWDSMWRRFIDRVLKETNVKERFTERDLRAKAGSDAGSLEKASKLLAHASTSITQKHYRRRVEAITPNTTKYIKGNN